MVPAESIEVFQLTLLHKRLRNVLDDSFFQTNTYSSSFTHWFDIPLLLPFHIFIFLYPFALPSSTLAAYLFLLVPFLLFPLITLYFATTFLLPFLYTSVPFPLHTAFSSFLSSSIYSDFSLLFVLFLKLLIISYVHIILII